MRIELEENGPFQVNTYLVMNEERGECVVIDPGFAFPRLVKIIEEEKLKLSAIISTHGHIDHIEGVSALKKQTGAAYYAPLGDEYLIRSAGEQARLFGLKKPEVIMPDYDLKDGDELNLAGFEIRVLHTPGHSRGSVSLVIGSNVFTGDVLFMDSIGRTDLPGGDYHCLNRTIIEKLFSLDPKTRVFPGHGPATTIGREKEHNPFFNMPLY